MHIAVHTYYTYRYIPGDVENVFPNELTWKKRHVTCLVRNNHFEAGQVQSEKTAFVCTHEYICLLHIRIKVTHVADSVVEDSLMRVTLQYSLHRWTREVEFKKLCDEASLWVSFQCPERKELLLCIWFHMYPGAGDILSVHTSSLLPIVFDSHFRVVCSFLHTTLLLTVFLSLTYKTTQFSRDESRDMSQKAYFLLSLWPLLRNPIKLWVTSRLK